MVLVVEHIEHASESFRMLSWSKSISKVEVIGPQNRRRVVKGQGEHWHVHAEAELTLFESGKGTRFVGDSILPVESPELLLFGPYVPHYWNCIGSSSGVALQFSIDKTQPLRATPEWDALSQTLLGSNQGLLFPTGAVENAHRLINVMIEQDRLARLGSFFQLLEMLSCYPGNPISSKAYSAADTTKHFPAIQKVILEVLNRYSEVLELKEMVELSQMSRATFCREFKNYTGRSFVEFLNEVRIDATCQKLSTSSEPVSDIAFQSGFVNLSHFNRIFRRLRGQSPREFRTQATSIG
ncbi:AraC family transcriptional regulator [Bythopirellula polymerisocia]|uniref:HTH-type transcriptional regulator ChbR n=1 Tax=Bythopirellula polymerisocia TaxID=2528003 RepID=A0A5C6CFH9_9BACT|nr:AraC family transcriptional regulator [Bythopirellula polymerisocia]TWU22785.1 HTH-type transcriptional regulator ChbR [Bythopirellula polymerisocia]